MTLKQKILVVSSSILVSVVVGGMLYLYFHRKEMLHKLANGEKINFKTKEPKIEGQDNKYKAKLIEDSDSDNGKTLVIYKDKIEIGKYVMKDDEPIFIDNNEKKNSITDKKELKLVKYFLSKNK